MVKNVPANAGDVGEGGSIPGRERALGEGNGNPPHYSCPGDPMDRSLVDYSPWDHREWDRIEHETLTQGVPGFCLPLLQEWSMSETEAEVI